MFEKLSLGAEKKVCGITVRKLPLGAWLRAMGKVKEIPEDFLEACFPDSDATNLNELVDRLTKLDMAGLIQIVGGAAITAPRFVAGIVAELVGVDENELIESPKIGIDGLLKIINALIEVNSLGEIRALAGQIVSKWRAASKATIGSNSL